MTIGLILDDTLDKPDGVQQAVLSIGSELTKRGHVVHYIVSDTNRLDITNIHSMGKSLNFKFNGNSVRTPLPVSSKKIKQLFEDVNFDVLHVQMPYSPLFASKVIKYAPKNIAKFGTFHILPYSFMSQIGTKILGFVLRKSLICLNNCFAVSKPSLEFMNKTFKVNGKIIPNPVDYSFYSSFKKKESKTKTIVFVGRFEERKGVIELVESYNLLDKNIRNKTKLIMCGIGPLLDEVIKLSESYSLNIEFPGFVSDSEKAQFLANADIAVFPSKAGESFGIVLAEAMSAGAGVTIGGNNPGYRSVLIDWPETIFDPTNYKNFTETIKNFLINEDTRNDIGLSQKQSVKKYDVKIVVDEIENEYKISLSLLNTLKQ
jgi:phosphatidylinositol alpha-mannosyltransferase